MRNHPGGRQEQVFQTARVSRLRAGWEMASQWLTLLPVVRVCLTLGSGRVPLKADPEMRIWCQQFIWEVTSEATMKERGKWAREMEETQPGWAIEQELRWAAEAQSCWRHWGTVWNTPQTWSCPLHYGEREGGYLSQTPVLHWLAAASGMLIPWLLQLPWAWVSKVSRQTHVPG